MSIKLSENLLSADFGILPLINAPIFSYEKCLSEISKYAFLAFQN